MQSLQVWVETFDLFGAGWFVQDRDVVHYRVACYHDRGHDGDSSVRWWTAPSLVLPNYRGVVLLLVCAVEQKKKFTCNVPKSLDDTRVVFRLPRSPRLVGPTCQSAETAVAKQKGKG